MMDSLADEKRQLEDRLIREKSLMVSESQGLSEQLQSCKDKLQETEQLFLRESDFRRQLQELADRLQAEKRDLQLQLQAQSDESDALRESLLQLQAKSQKDDVALDSLRRKTEEQDALLLSMQADLDDAVAAKAAFEAEKEEWTGQISVLTEERDAARVNEEVQFEALRDRTTDLEKLQESYVHMTDRCNDYQDELCDLREKIEYLLQEKAEQQQQARGPSQSVSVSAGPVGRALSPRSVQSSRSAENIHAAAARQAPAAAEAEAPSSSVQRPRDRNKSVDDARTASGGAGVGTGSPEGGSTRKSTDDNSLRFSGDAARGASGAAAAAPTAVSAMGAPGYRDTKREQQPHHHHQQEEAEEGGEGEYYDEEDEYADDFAD